MSYIFTSESVSEGHPDKLCDRISDAIADLYLSKDNNARTAIETLATTNRVIISGETSSNAFISKEEIEDVVRKSIKDVGYNQKNFSWQSVDILNLLHTQSADIALGVDNDGAGDQGIMFGYAKKEDGFDTQYMPMPIYLSHKILHSLAKARKSNMVSGLEPDAKSQVTVKYENGKPVEITKLVVSHQHKETLSREELNDIICNSLQNVLPNGWMPANENIFINPTGRFVIGGPDGDTGLTGRKIVVDTYGGFAPHGGGAFSGKDPTKVDRSAAYALRYLAKNVVAAGLADSCLLQISYAIGKKDPLSLYIDCNKTNKVDEQKILKLLPQLVDLTPKGIIKHLKLNAPIYTPTSAYGHFGRVAGSDGTFSWEKLDLVESLKNEFSL